jgi:ribose/xylose/arabinose/galactoside ABC-type transport system permease subunit
MGRYETDDPTGGRGLTRRLAVALPCSLVLGLAIGLVLGVMTDEWRLVPLVALTVAGIVGGVLAALEDGRVQRRLDERNRRRRAGASPTA